MKNALQLNTSFTRIEFWAATTLFAFVMFFFITDGLDTSNPPFKPFFDREGVDFYFYKHFYIPQLIRNVSFFLAFLYMNFVVVPKLVTRQRPALNILLLLFVFLVLAAILGITDTYLRAYQYLPSKTIDATELMFKEGLEDAFTIFVVFAIYTVIKYASLYVISLSPVIESKYRFVRREGVIASVIWIIGLLGLIISNAPPLLIIGWIIAVPSAILLYLVGFYEFIPSSLNKKYPFISYWKKNVVVLLIILMAWGLILKLIVGGDQAHLAALWIFNSVLQLSTTVPITWALYKRQMKGNEQLNVLKRELGQSNASFDFLRSQINPHFLFNALNTIYGTALQEGAERTSEAVQKLGDMMRFMLQENMQEKISLARELDYLNNYISLQKLRTAVHPDIKIETEIRPAAESIQVAPMLFIPFVENAFKHGISFREPSNISIALEAQNGIINFDVQNSKHLKQAHDPEADKSGIGLGNVKQRLQLLYPGRHELEIRETDKDFFVHLSIQTV
jgi:two-component system LytT family sensor kinase